MLLLLTHGCSWIITLERKVGLHCSSQWTYSYHLNYSKTRISVCRPENLTARLLWEKLHPPWEGQWEAPQSSCFFALSQSRHLGSQPAASQHPNVFKPWILSGIVGLSAVGGGVLHCTVFLLKNINLLIINPSMRMTLQTYWIIEFFSPSPFFCLVVPLYLQFYAWYILWVWKTPSGDGFLEAHRDIHQIPGWVEGTIPVRRKHRMTGSPEASLCRKPTLSKWVSKALHTALRDGKVHATIQGHYIAMLS